MREDALWPGDRRSAAARRFRALALALGVLPLLLVQVACATPEQRYRVLSFFFDEVPLPPSMVAAAELPAAGEAEVAAGAIPPVTLIPTLVQHAPFSEKACLECHDRDISQGLVAEKSELCWNCHDEEDFQGKVLHGPVAAGECVGCHDPHESENDYMLKSAASAICERCHDEESFPQVVQHRAEQGEACLDCHNPHAADRPFMLTTKAPPEPAAAAGSLRTPPESPL